MVKKICGVNGFGRFGLHLLNYYLESIEKSNFDLKYINDDLLTIDKAYEIIMNDPFVKIYEKFDVKRDDNYLVFNKTHRILFTNNTSSDISWLGLPDLFLECSGQFTDANLARVFKVGNTSKVLISATSLNADKTLVYGFNHFEYTPEMDVISYGSCTVNAYVALTSCIHDLFSINTSDINVIHNVPEYQLLNGSIETPGLPRVPIKRKGCTLTKVAPKLLEFISDSNFNVNYTLIPYTGVSIIDYRYSLKKTPNEDFWSLLENECKNGRLKDLYAIEEKDMGPEVHQNSKFSSVIIKDNSSIRGNEVYLNAYFDNENSANRFFDLTNYIVTFL
jgi:glyceraldehyde 3-phosphate dehydrogenase